MEKLLKLSMPMAKFLFLTVVTIGAFPIVWLAANLETLNTFITGRKIKMMDIAIVGALFWWPLVLQSAVVTQPADIQTIFKILWSVTNIAMYIYLYVYITKPFMESLNPILEQYQVVLKRKKLRSFILSYIYMLSTINHLNRLKEKTT
ncbi:MAG: hypothetical protein Q7J51_07400 [Sheuella sp.]|jgi:hypothetical protein|nr:hypothetical protein [Sheuella sp.]